MHPLLTTAVKAARRAGHIIVRHLDRLDRIEVQTKSRNDFVSDVDLLAEDEIVQVIRATYPGHSILAEESGRQHGTEDYEWIIDPLDGTTNFLHGHPQFSVSIAVRHHDHIEHGVVFDPLRNELFTASRGNGAHLNDRRIRVSRVLRLRDALLGTGFPYTTLEHLDAWMATFQSLLTRTSGIRRAGSAALDLAYVATGRFDGFWEMNLREWDLAAGCLLVEEAGGLVGDLNGGQEHLASGHILAANATLFGDMLEIIRARIESQARRTHIES